MRALSKSKLVAFCQCPKRLWLEVHRPDLREDSYGTEVGFSIGFKVGDIARLIYDPTGMGAVIDIGKEGFEQAFARSFQLLSGDQPIFEAGFSAGGALAFADVMLPKIKKGRRVWQMIEVKSSAKVKDYHRDDVAIQAYVAQLAGVSLTSVAVATVDTSWVYSGGNDYNGLLKEHDLTEEVFARSNEVKVWIAGAQEVVSLTEAPAAKVGKQCNSPFACGFIKYCSEGLYQAEHPMDWLPNITSEKLDTLHEVGVQELAEVPDTMLSEIQRRVKTHTLANTVYFNAEGAAHALKAYPLPAYFLDFETISFAVPIWAGTRPYQKHTFQYSLHTLLTDGQLRHHEFLDVSGNDPTEAFAHDLVLACDKPWPVFVYNAAFEKGCLNDLAQRYPKLREPLIAIGQRLVDLLPIAKAHYYHPTQHGSWSIKSVLPAAVPELSYSALEGVQDGGMAMEAYLEAIHPETTAIRKSEIKQRLLAYCKLDTYAMVRLWQVFAQRTDWQL